MIFFWYCIAISIITVALNIYLLFSFYTIKQVKVQPLIENEPPVVIIIAARNEEEDIEKALTSACNINYSNYRIIVINDRSTDRTAEILAGFVKIYPKVTVETITNLPDEWLGKNNALYQGYLQSTEEWMLFTDADIVFHPDAINKAVGYALKNNLDHLTMLPDLKSRSTLLNSVFATFSIMLMLHMKPWDAKKPKSKASASIGAFNLIRRSAYEKIGTHERIKLRPDDDLQLGVVIKATGLRQDVLAGNDYVSLEWYKNLKEFGEGVRKNSFSTAGYKLSKAILDVISIVVSVALPMPLMFIFGSADIRILACFVLFTHIIYMIMVPPNKWWYALMIPFSGFFLAWIFLKSTIITLKQGGIYWRGNFYSLQMLREGSEY